MCTKAIAAACLAILLATISMNSSPAIAQDENAYPSRPVRIVVPLPAGSAASPFAREITVAI